MDKILKYMTMNLENGIATQYHNRITICGGESVDKLDIILEEVLSMKHDIDNIKNTLMILDSNQNNIAVSIKKDIQSVLNNQIKIVEEIRNCK